MTDQPTTLTLSDDARFMALADVAAALADCPVVMIANVHDDRVVFNAAATTRDRDMIARWQPLIADRSPLEIGDLRDGTERARARSLAASAPDMRFCLLLPLDTGQGERAATLCVADREARRLTPAQRAGLVALTALTPAATPPAAGASDPLRDLLADIVDREISRRLQLSGELHDHSMQWLAATRLALTGAIEDKSEAVRIDQLRQCRSLIDDSIAQLRALQFDLYPPLLRDFGLHEALRWLGEQFHDEHGMDCDVVATTTLPALDPRLSGFLYFTVRELWLRSATRRNARRSVVNLTCRNDSLELTLRDDGTAQTATPPDGTRVHRLESYLNHKGGALQIRAASGGGQIITLDVPLTPAESTKPSAAAAVSVTASHS